MTDNLSLGDMNSLNGNGINKKGEFLYSGDEIAGYNIIHKHSVGGIRQVYLAENIQMHKEYALKVLPSNLSSDKRFIDRFRVEVSVMADLKHPNIAYVKTINHNEILNLYNLVMNRNISK
jgi:serine/threonine protein kinase